MPSDGDLFTLTKRPAKSRQYETEPPLGHPAGVQIPYSSPLKAELALWRAFLGDEIDAILRDKD